MILDNDQHITKTITNVELTLDLIKYLGWYTDSDKLGFISEWTFFNKNYPNTNIKYECDSKRFIFVYLSERLNKLVYKCVSTYEELMTLLNDYRKR